MAVQQPVEKAMSIVARGPVGICNLGLELVQLPQFFKTHIGRRSHHSNCRLLDKLDLTTLVTRHKASPVRSFFGLSETARFTRRRGTVFAVGLQTGAEQTGSEPNLSDLTSPEQLVLHLCALFSSTVDREVSL